MNRGLRFYVRLCQRLCLCAGSVFLVACLPLQPPARIVPQHDALSGKPAPGNGRVVLDVVGRRCRVRLANTHPAADRSVILQMSKPDRRFVFCVTPCEVELVLGAHMLTFCEEVILTVRVGQRPSVFRAAIRGGETPATVQWEPQAGLKSGVKIKGTP